MGQSSSEGQMLVRLLRSARGWTQEQLAEAAALDASTIYRYEAGQIQVSEEALERLARAAGLSSTFLRSRFQPFVAALQAEIGGSSGESRAHVERLAEGIGRKVGAIAREEALQFLSRPKASQ